jgi:hypothetical protein
MPLIARQGAVVRDAVNRVRNQPDFAHGQVRGMVSRMGDYQIITDGAGYQILEAMPCARPRVGGGFGTKTEARAWLIHRLAEPTEAETERWMRQRAAWRARFAGEMLLAA